MRQTSITDDTQALISIMPERIAKALVEANHVDQLIEVVIDLGRKPVARFLDHEVELDQQEISSEDLAHILDGVGSFDSDNRAGLPKTLHRISAIRNRKKEVVGLTCRVGRAVYGMVDLIEDLVMSDKNILLLGRPGVGKTTMLREAARILSEKKRVIIVDTSNEIGGDGDIPHPGVGKARRMQVACPSQQHEVMIEAVENHNPQAIIIDEIGREMEAHAARTIAERGVQLIATAHGFALENLVQNPTLSDLVGGVENVTLSDEEARNRGCQKTVRERKAPPTFDVLVEIQSFQRCAIYHDLADAVDRLLRGFDLDPEIRFLDENGEIVRQNVSNSTAFADIAHILDYRPNNGKKNGRAGRSGKNGTGSILRVYPIGVSHRLLNQVIKDNRMLVILTKDMQEADVVLFLKDAKKRNDALLHQAEALGLTPRPVSTNSAEAIQTALLSLVPAF